jgi:AraC family transcriptional regulator of adaptative response/methylated-DNA-[protein]-cysteine methyltransferase
VEYAKQLLKEKQATLFDTAFETGLSGTGRLHDLFIKVEGMTPGEFKKGGEHLTINYSFAESPFGNLIVASTAKGICYMSFCSEEEQAFLKLSSQFPNAAFRQMVDSMQQDALFIFQRDWSKLNQIKLHLAGTHFQLKVWEALLRVPMGKLTSYGSLAKELGKPGASRAVGNAVGSNPVAYLIPCHRVIQSSGETGDYKWGGLRKSAMIGWEAAKISENTPV